jgi:hypothetical protein
MASSGPECGKMDGATTDHQLCRCTDGVTLKGGPACGRMDGAMHLSLALTRQNLPNQTTLVEFMHGSRFYQVVCTRGVLFPFSVCT